MTDDNTIKGDDDEPETPIDPKHKTVDTDDDELRDVGDGVED